MEGMTPGRIVHYVAPIGDFTTCRPMIVVEVHSPKTVSGKVFGPTHDDWKTSVMESDPKRGQTDTFHDPRGCPDYLVDVVEELAKMAEERASG